MRMSATSVFRGSVAALAVAATLAPAAADDGIALVRVARDLGYRYAYLPVENAVSLSRPGTTIVVRPGDSFFSVNARREPVYGMVPTYRNNDVVVSRAFESEIRAYAPRVSVVDQRDVHPAQDGVSTPIAPETGNVATVRAYYQQSESTIFVEGKATPGSRVTLVLRADLSENLPVVTLDGVDTFADANGRFHTNLDSAPDRFTFSRFFVEATAPGDATPAIAAVVDGKANASARTSADHILDR